MTNPLRRATERCYRCRFLGTFTRRLVANVPWSVGIGIVVATMILSTGSAGLVARVAQGREPAGVTVRGDYQLYLPMVSKGYLDGGDASRLGVWLSGVNSSTTGLIDNLGANWVRIPLVWSLIEPSYTVPGTYDFSSYDRQFAMLSAAGLTPLVEIRGNPAWAATTNCGPIDKPGGTAAFSRFLGALVTRYKQPAYNVRNWEFYNEPDNTDPNMGAWLGGCWGNRPNEYAAMLQVANAAVKAADPEAKVFLGGLGNENPPVEFNMNFADQILAAGAGNYLDVMNIHYFSSHSVDWASYGLDIGGKVNAIWQTMAKYGVSKPVAVTELSWTSSSTSSPDFPELQARYVPKVLARGASLDLYAMVWFLLVNPQADVPYGLTDPDMKLRPAYYAYQTTANELNGAKYVRRLTPAEVGASGSLEGYVFDAGYEQRWVLWVEQSQMQITLPSGSKVARDKLGGNIPLASGAPTSILLGDSPIFVRLQ